MCVTPSFQTKGSLNSFAENRIQDGFEIVANLGVGEAHDTHAEIFDHFRAALVVVDKPLVLHPVPPDRSPGVRDAFRRVAIEVGDVAIERDLPAELRAVKTRAARAQPKDVFGGRHLLAKGAGKFVRLGCHVRHAGAAGPPTPAPLPLGEGSSAPASLVAASHTSVGIHSAPKKAARTVTPPSAGRDFVRDPLSREGGAGVRGPAIQTKGSRNASRRRMRTESTIVADLSVGEANDARAEVFDRLERPSS